MRLEPGVPEQGSRVSRTIGGRGTETQLAASLAELLRHGERLGLHDGKCPLCDVARTAQQFVEGLHALDFRLRNTGSDIQAAYAELQKANEESEEIAAQLQKCIQSVNDLEVQERSIAEREATLAKNLREAGVNTAGTGAGSIQDFVTQERSRLIDVERSILTLEASRSIDQLAELEGRSDTLRKDADAAADRLAKAKRAQVAAKDEVMRSTGRAWRSAMSDWLRLNPC